tara:strand:+ start:938 stop:1234 length:297 start_codon:yes stop_codon:yes gene_type:complete
MNFLQIISFKKHTLISIFLCVYVVLNFLDGERGLISYYEKQQIIDQLINKKSLLSMELEIVENKNNLLSNNIDLDYLELLYRKKFMVGKSNEIIYNDN